MSFAIDSILISSNKEGEERDGRLLALCLVLVVLSKFKFWLKFITYSLRQKKNFNLEDDVTSPSLKKKKLNLGADVDSLVILIV